MKKTSKKNKIIILTAIALIIVIIGILIGTNVIKVNIFTGKYNSSNGSSSNGNLLPEYIKSGITLAGVTGTLEDLDTSDATATAEDIAWGKTAYVDGKKITGTKIVPITDLNPDEVYYADLTGDGTVDGVIYADLAVGGSGVWHNNSWSNYSYEAETGLKEYYIIKEEYKDDFGTGKVIAPIKGTSGKERFYVMALDDIDNSLHYWWQNAEGKLDSRYDIELSTNDFAVAGVEPTGLVNTKRMMECYKNEKINGQTVAKGTDDMWGLIEEQFNAGWFVPSKSEWSAFGDKLNINTIVYGNRGLSDVYWSSSQYNPYLAYSAYFSVFHISYKNVAVHYAVRLSTTF